MSTRAEGGKGGREGGKENVPESMMAVVALWYSWRWPAPFKDTTVPW